MRSKTRSKPTPTQFIDYEIATSTLLHLASVVCTFGFLSRNQTALRIGARAGAALWRWVRWSRGCFAR
ncbi:MAG: hypothetical protein ACJAVR_003398 [Paracoccaceae bacterium]|jgi:hypothetical protein